MVFNTTSIGTEIRCSNFSIMPTGRALFRCGLRVLIFFGDYYDIYFHSGDILGSNQLPCRRLHRQGGDIHRCSQARDSYNSPLGGVLVVPAVRPGAGRQGVPDSAPLMRFPGPWHLHRCPGTVREPGTWGDSGVGRGGAPRGGFRSHVAHPSPLPSTRRRHSRLGAPGTLANYGRRQIVECVGSF